MEIQRLLGSDIVMAFDECADAPRPRDAQVARRWSARCAGRSAVARRVRCAAATMPRARRCSASSRARSTKSCAGASAEALIEIGFDGYAVGGLAVGEGQEAMFAVLDFAPGQLPADRPRYLMGVGKPDDIVGAVERGIDMFDCVLPTRSGRTGQAFTRDGPINIRNARFAEDQGPLDPDCACPVCATWTRAYLHHLVRRRDPRRDADDRAQSLVLPAADGGSARRDRGGAAHGLRGSISATATEGASPLPEGEGWGGGGFSAGTAFFVQRHPHPSLPLRGRSAPEPLTSQSPPGRGATPAHPAPDGTKPSPVRGRVGWGRTALVMLYRCRARLPPATAASPLPPGRGSDLAQRGGRLLAGAISTGKAARTAAFAGMTRPRRS